MDSRLTAEIFSIKKLKQMLKEWFIIPMVVLSQTLNRHWKELFCICETEKSKTKNSTSFYTSLLNEYLKKKKLKRCCFLTISENLLKFQ